MFCDMMVARTKVVAVHFLGTAREAAQLNEDQKKQQLK